MRLVLIVLLAAIMLPAAVAAGLVAQSPASGASVVADDLTFSFSSTGNDVMEDCALYVDGIQKKRLSYGYKVSSLSYKVILDDGEHEWYAECTTEDGDVLNTTPRTFTQLSDIHSGVEIIPTGERGVFIHEFHIQNIPEQNPVIIPELYPGDYVSVIMAIPPSKITKELFVRGRYYEEGQTYLWLTHGSDDFKIFLGENTSIPMGTSEFILHFREILGSKITLVAYPRLIDDDGEDTEPEPDVTEPDEEQEEVPDDSTEETPKPEEEQEKVPDETPPDTPEEPEEVPAPPPSTPEQSGFQRFLSWLTRIFGS